jgi:hypothetical protein
MSFPDLRNEKTLYRSTLVRPELSCLVQLPNTVLDLRKRHRQGKKFLGDEIVSR